MQESDHIIVAIRSMSESLGKRIESTEADFVGHLKKVEDRLDALVDLTKTVAVLQTQTAHYVDELSELRTAFRESANRVDSLLTAMQQKSDVSVARVHNRLDELTNSMRDRIDLSEKDTQITVKTAMASQDTAIADSHSKVEALSIRLESWVSWGKGAWAILAIVGAVAGWVVNRWLNDLDMRTAEVPSLKMQVQTLEGKVSDTHDHIMDHFQDSKNGTNSAIPGPNHIDKYGRGGTGK